MKTIFTIILCLTVSFSAFTQLANKKVSKNLNAVVAVKPSNTKLKNTGSFVKKTRTSVQKRIKN